jgi:hypothetical protein
VEHFQLSQAGRQQRISHLRTQGQRQVHQAPETGNGGGGQQRGMGKGSEWKLGEGEISDLPSRGKHQQRWEHEWDTVAKGCAEPSCRSTAPSPGPQLLVLLLLQPGGVVVGIPARHRGHIDGLMEHMYGVSVAARWVFMSSTVYMFAAEKLLTRSQAPKQRAVLCSCTESLTQHPPDAPAAPCPASMHPPPAAAHGTCVCGVWLRGRRGGGVNEAGKRCSSQGISPCNQVWKRFRVC